MLQRIVTTYSILINQYQIRGFQKETKMQAILSESLKWNLTQIFWNMHAPILCPNFASWVPSPCPARKCSSLGIQKSRFQTKPFAKCISLYGSKACFRMHRSVKASPVSESLKLPCEPRDRCSCFNELPTRAAFPHSHVLQSTF